MPRSAANAIRWAEQSTVPDVSAQREVPCPFKERHARHGLSKRFLSVGSVSTDSLALHCRCAATP